MPRPVRLDWPGCRHHVMNRGARREPVFLDDTACVAFVGFVSELPRRFGILVHAYARSPKARTSSQVRHLPTDRLVLRAVARVCGVTQDALSETRRGRAGNTPRKLAAYWLVVGAELKNTEAGARIGMHPVRVSQAIRELREKMAGAPALSETMAELRERILNR